MKERCADEDDDCVCADAMRARPLARRPNHSPPPVSPARTRTVHWLLNLGAYERFLLLFHNPFVLITTLN